MPKKIEVGILGATGAVGQRFVELLENHPWFHVTELAASEKSAGKTYEEAMQGRWKISADIPEYARKMKVKECIPPLKCKLVFSGLDAAVAGDIEGSFAKTGYIVSSNAKNYRMEPDVPLLIPEVNAEHLNLIKIQQKKRNWKGFIITNPNCTTIGMVMALAPIHKKFGVKKVVMTSMQALSGAGYPGVPSMDILDNVIPYIGGEEEKVEAETLKLLGNFAKENVVFPKMKVSAHCNRVNVKDGHTETVSFELTKKAGINEIKKELINYNPLKNLNLPSAPKRPIVYREEADRPQPRLDRDLEKGMAAVVGRLRPCKVLDYKFTVLSHNTIRGAAGCAILNAELLKAKGFLD